MQMQVSSISLGWGAVGLSAASAAAVQRVHVFLGWIVGLTSSRGEHDLVGPLAIILGSYRTYSGKSTWNMETNYIINLTAGGFHKVYI